MANEKSKLKRVSINAFEGIMKEMDFGGYKSYNWRGIDIQVRKYLPLKAMLEFVKNVVGSCMSDDKGYNPEAKEFAIKTNILTMYANFTMPSNIELHYDLVYKTDAVTYVLEHIDEEQIEEIRFAIDERIRYLIHVNVSAIQKQMMDINSAFNNIQNQFSDMFSGLDEGAIKTLTDAIAEHKGLNEEALVEAFIKSKKDEQEDDAD